eukprot:6291172-Amphidinium_carterae.2
MDRPANTNGKDKSLHAPSYDQTLLGPWPWNKVPLAKRTTTRKAVFALEALVSQCSTGCGHVGFLHARKDHTFAVALDLKTKRYTRSHCLAGT